MIKKRGFCILCFMVVLIGVCSIFVNTTFMKSKASSNRVYISTSGKNSGDGSVSNPYGSIEYAVENVQKINSTDIEFVLAKGTHYINKTLDLSFLSKSGKNITFTNQNNEAVFVSGGKVIRPSDCKKEGNVYTVSLDNFDLSEKKYLSSPQLYINNKAYKLAQYPNQSYLKCTSLSGTTYSFNDNHLKDIKIDSNTMALGFPGFDWNFEELKVSEINGNKVTVQGEVDYGYNDTGRFAIANVRSELDVEGEYYIDYGEKKLYFIYNSNISNASIELSQTKYSLFYMENVKNITFKNIAFKDCVGSLFDTTGCENIKWENCDLYNASDKGIVMWGGKNNIVLNSRIYNTGQGGVAIESGDRNTLTESGNKVQKCVIHDFNLLQKTYCPAVSAKGCGIVVEENKIYNSEHMAIYLNGNKIEVRKNDISKCLSETADCGTIYCGRDWAGFGNIIDSNYIHDNPGASWAWGIYADDQQSGTTITNNFIENGSGGMLIGGGGYNIIKNNTISNMKYSSIVFDERGLEWDQQQMYDNLNKVQYNNSIWKSTYPELAELLENHRLPYKNQVIDNNYYKAPEPNIAPSVYKYSTVKNNIKLTSKPENTIKIDVSDSYLESNVNKQNEVIGENIISNVLSDTGSNKNASNKEVGNSSSTKDNNITLDKDALDEIPKTGDKSELEQMLFVFGCSMIICLSLFVFIKRIK